MSNFKNQQTKLLATEMAGEIMEYLTGLNEENEAVIRHAAEKFSKKIVKAYHAAIKSQYRKSLRVVAKNDTVEIEAAEPFIYSELRNLIAS